MLERLAILGASGDLTWRRLIPALAELQAFEELPSGFAVRGIGLDPWDSEQFRDHVRSKLGGKVSPTVMDMLTFARADVTDPASLSEALQPLDQPTAVYLALPPAVLLKTIRALAGAGLPEGSRIVIEKPFGQDVASAQALNALLHETFSEEAIFRIDHFLALQTTQNILGLRFANRIFEPIWNQEHVRRVDIIWDETLALEGRANYYDSNGALKDMIQNHLLQLLCLVAMEPPLSLSPNDLRDRKLDLLRAVRPFTPDAVRRQTRRARYSAGRIDGRVVPSYVDEDGVDPKRGTDTFAEVTLYVDNWRWAGIPFKLRTGKALRQSRREISITFKPVPHLAFGEVGAARLNVLRMSLNPDTMSLSVNVNGPGDFLTLIRTELSVGMGEQQRSAHAHLLFSVLKGDMMLAIGDQEAVEAWRLLEPIMETWSAGYPPLVEYPAGSSGPPDANEDRLTIA